MIRRRALRGLEKGLNLEWNPGHAGTKGNPSKSGLAVAIGGYSGCMRIKPYACDVIFAEVKKCFTAPGMFDLYYRFP
jgi:hypothetical protein